jgi:ATP-dependent Clp protease ATP-binding subunit ClpC
MDEIENQALSELKRIFNPEFLNRVDDIIVFHPLNIKQVEAIFDIELAELAARLAEQEYRIHILPTARRYLIEKGWDPKFGGRPLRRTLQKELEDPLSALLLEHNWPAGTVFTASCRNGKIKLKEEAPAAASENDPEYIENAVEELIQA